MRIVGIIGPYFSGGDRRLIDHNIANAQYLAIKIANYFSGSMLVGFFCPHLHTARFEKLAGAKEEYYHTLDDAIYDLACEAFVLLPGWENSQGSRRDCERAKNKKKLIFELPSYESSDIDSFLMTLFEWACKPV